jgi:hypothetical protein
MCSPTSNTRQTNTNVFKIKLNSQSERKENTVKRAHPQNEVPSQSDLTNANANQSKSTDKKTSKDQVTRPNVSLVGKIGKPLTEVTKPTIELKSSGALLPSQFDNALRNALQAEHTEFATL